MSYHHINTFERGYIDTLHKIGYNTREIGEKIGRHHSAIARELRRNKQENSYCCERAQKIICTVDYYLSPGGNAHLRLSNK